MMSALTAQHHQRLTARVPALLLSPMLMSIGLTGPYGPDSELGTGDWEHDRVRVLTR